MIAPATATPAAAADHERGNAGDPAGAIEAAQRVLDLVRDQDGLWFSRDAARPAGRADDAHR
jgi:hypothetical protein